MKQNNKNRKILKQFGGADQESYLSPDEIRNDLTAVADDAATPATAADSDAPPAPDAAAAAPATDDDDDAAAADDDPAATAAAVDPADDPADGPADDPAADSADDDDAPAAADSADDDAPAAADSAAEGGSNSNNNAASASEGYLNLLSIIMELNIKLKEEPSFESKIKDDSLDDTVVIIEDLYNKQIRFFPKKIFESTSFEKQEGNLGIINIDDIFDSLDPILDISKLKVGDKLINTRDKILYTVERTDSNVVDIKPDKLIKRENTDITDENEITLDDNNKDDYKKYVKYIDININANNDGSMELGVNNNDVIKKVIIEEKKIEPNNNNSNEELQALKSYQDIHIIPHGKFIKYLVENNNIFLKHNGVFEKFSSVIKKVEILIKQIEAVIEKIKEGNIPFNDENTINILLLKSKEYIINIREYIYKRFKTLVFSIKLAELENENDIEKIKQLITEREGVYLKKLKEINEGLEIEYDKIKNDPAMREVIEQVDAQNQGDMIANQAEEKGEDQEKRDNTIEIEIQDNNDGNSFSITNLKDLIDKVNKLINETNLNLIKAEIDDSEEVEEGKEEGKEEGAAAAAAAAAAVAGEGQGEPESTVEQGGGGKIYNSGKDFGNIKYKHSFKRRGQKLKRRIKNKHSVDKKNKKKQSSRKK